MFACDDVMLYAKFAAFRKYMYLDETKENLSNLNNNSKLVAVEWVCPDRLQCSFHTAMKI